MGPQGCETMQLLKQLKVVQQLELDPEGVRPYNYLLAMIPTPSLHIFVKESVLMRSLLRVSIHPYRGRTHSAFKFLIGDVEIGVVVVTVEAANGEQVGNPQMKKNGDCKWTVTYNIPGDCHYKISVSVNGVEAKGGPFKGVQKSKLTKGTKVRRGRDWTWDNQDGGPPCIGEVVQCSTRRE